MYLGGSSYLPIKKLYKMTLISHSTLLHSSKTTSNYLYPLLLKYMLNDYSMLLFCCYVLFLNQCQRNEALSITLHLSWDDKRANSGGELLGCRSSWWLCSNEVVELNACTVLLPGPAVWSWAGSCQETLHNNTIMLNITATSPITYSPIYTTMFLIHKPSALSESLMLVTHTHTHTVSRDMANTCNQDNASQ